jgi:CubicO group peptidase (beta-lactamase class C family)
MRAFAIVAAVCACAAPMEAQEPSHPIDSAAVARFADEFFPREMPRRRIPGLVFVFVSRGEITVARGYGAAELESGRRVDPDRTQFRLASVSKAITATAALKLVEDGRLDLHRSVNAYLSDFHITEERGTITLHHLLTHTAGFDERLTGMAARSPAGLQPLADYLARSMPPVFVEPGRVISYSNHGLGLVGLLVQQASGRPFGDFVREQLFEPLGMLRSGALIGPVPDDLAVAYDVTDERYQALPPEYLQITPAGAFFTTGTDMGRFLIAHLRGGAYRDRRILRPATVALMHAQHFAQSPGMSGWAYGLWEDMRNGDRALLHNGGGKGYRALMYLLPYHDAGFFVAYNLADRHDEGELQEVFITQFRERFVPARGSVDVASSGSASIERLVGDYLYVRRARTTMESFISVVNRVSVGIGENGALSVVGSSGGPVELMPVGPLRFRRTDGRGIIDFQLPSESGPQRLLMTIDSGFPAAYERVSLAASLPVQVGWLVSMVLVFLYAAVWRSIASLRRKQLLTSGETRGPSRWLGSTASALNLVFLVGFPIAFLGRIEGGLPDFVYGVPLAARALLLVPVVTGIIAVATLISVVVDFRNPRTSPRRLVDCLVVAALLSFVAFAWYWNLLPSMQEF